MKNSGRCVKCQHADILRIEGQSGAHGAGNNIQVGWTIFSAVKVTRFLCASCGYSEEWIEDPADLQKLVEKFRP
jgi:predicted nucleic-acid-binding Zn-ribbon protein